MIVLMAVIGRVTGDLLTLDGFDKITRPHSTMSPFRHATFVSNGSEKYQRRSFNTRSIEAFGEPLKATFRPPLHNAEMCLGALQLLQEYYDILCCI
jgi:hypothetical protein